MDSDPMDRRGGPCSAPAPGRPASQFGAPRGLAGRLVLAAMAVKNGAYNRAALRALALGPGDRVLEIGCGPGVALRRALRRVGRAGFAAGVDHAPLAVAVSTRRNARAIAAGRARVVQAGAQALPFEGGAFNRAFAVNSFQFWPDPEAGMAEVARVLVPGGRFALVQRAAGPDTRSNIAGAQGGWQRIEQAVSLAGPAGFEVVDVTQEPVGKLVAAVALFARR